ncbi:hypothetical protein [Streptomyces sp. NBC_00358]|uniref:hypothetical protein n=1 Tax=Streptomyces sp. NBC_00358 TaxID=2975725 RepID=UPI002E2744BE
MFVAVAQEPGHQGLEEAVLLGRKQDFELSSGYVAHQHRQLGDDFDTGVWSPEPEFRDRAVNGGKEDTFRRHRQVSAMATSARVTKSCGTADSGVFPTIQCGDRLGDTPPVPLPPYQAKEWLGHDGEDRGVVEGLPHRLLPRLSFSMIKIALSLPSTSGPAPQNDLMARPLTPFRTFAGRTS